MAIEWVTAVSRVIPPQNRVRIALSPRWSGSGSGRPSYYYLNS